MKKFLLGLIVGSFLTAGLYFFFAPAVKLKIEVGRFLDQDVVYLKGGGLIRGWVLSQEGDDILVETEKGSFTLPRSACARIERDVFLRFVRQVM